MRNTEKNKTDRVNIMVTIVIKEAYINAIGHAEDKETCALFSSLCTTISNLLELAGEPECVPLLVDGHFYMALDKIQTDKGLFLADGFKNNLHILAEQYPNSFKIIDYTK